MGLSASDRAIVSSLVLYVPLGFVLFVVFVILRLEFPRFYNARRQHGYPTPATRSGVFSWISPTLKYAERDMLSTHGLDAVMILRVARTGLYMLALMFLYGWIVIAPINATGSNKNRDEFQFSANCTCSPPDCANCRNNNPIFTKGLGIISIANIDPGNTSETVRLFAHLIGIYLISAFGLYLLYCDWRAFAEFRVRHLAQRRIAASSVLVQGLGLPKHSPLDEAENAIAAYFSRMFPNDVSRVIVSAAADPIRKLMGHWNKAIDKIETYHVKDNNEKARKWSEKKARIRTRVQELQSHMSAGVFALVTFRSRITAALASRAVLTTCPDVLRPRWAPDPHDVNWRAADTSLLWQRLRSIVVFIIAVLLIIFWSIPITFAASLANISDLSKQVTFLRPIVNWSPVITSIISGILPTLVVFILFKLLFKFIRFLALQRRLYSFSETENTTRNLFFSFQFFNVVLVFAISGALFRNLKAFLDALSFNRVVDLLAVSLPPQVTFFSIYVITAAVLDQMLDLIRPGDLVLGYLRQRLAKTPRQKEEADKPPVFDYAQQYTYLALFLVISLTFWLMSPFITIWGLVYFLLHYLVMKHNLLYTFRPHYEGGGILWPAAFAQIAFSLVFFQLVMFGVFGAYRFVGAPAVLPLIPITILIAIYMHRQWKDVAEQGALERLCGKPGKVHSYGAAEEDDEEEADPHALHEGDYVQPERQRLQDEVLDLQEYGWPN